MSLILEGIDMPKDGEWLSVIIKPTKEVIVDTIRYGDYALLNTEYGSAIQIPKGHGRLIDLDKLSHNMYHQAFETDSDMQKWESGCWIRYKMFEIERDNAPTILEADEL